MRNAFVFQKGYFYCSYALKEMRGTVKNIARHTHSKRTPIMSIFYELIRWHHRITEDRRGTVTIIFGLMVFILLASSGIAMDTSRINRLTMRINSALDAAALATARQLRLSGNSDAELVALAEAYFNTNMRDQIKLEGRVENFSVQIDRERNGIIISAEAVLPTVLGRIFNVSEFRTSLEARSIYTARDIELSMMLDVSGSMAGSKIRDLRDAAKDLAAIVLDNSRGPTKNKIGIAPYSTSVNAGIYARLATAGASNSCVTERSGSEAFTDSDPISFPLKKKTSNCPSSTVLPLTNELSTIESHVDSLRDGGRTAGHLGIAWAWYLVSPKWASFWPSSSAPGTYDDPEIMKAVIVMTDGEFNTAYESANGNSFEQSEQLCTNMKRAGVIVFSVGFQAPSSALQVLRGCASKPTYFYDAQSGDELRGSFKRIANELTALRLTM
jgi:Flp pilus assembly protein TadG